VGVLERASLKKTNAVKPGDLVLALPSTGLHTNGYSLARKLVFEHAGLQPETYVAEVSNKIGAELLRPHRCYWPMLKTTVARGWLSAMAHITGGGIPGNLPRVLPRGVQAEIELGSWPVPAIFSYLAGLGKLERDELLRTFNMGVGMILVVPLENHRAVETELKRRREKFYRIGVIRRSDPRKPQVAFTGKLPL
jgi:phosphoribosylformylglycinamidine cyclo-ligase